MINEFIPYQQASQLKELGFDEPTTVWRQHGNGISGDVEGKRDYYNKKGNVYTSLPTYSQTFKFFRDKHELYYTIEGSKKEGFQYFVYTYEYEIKSEELFKTYEETELNCINKLIEIIKLKEPFLYMKKEQFAVYEKEPAHGKDKDGIILAPFNTKEDAEQARLKYGYDSDNYYVAILKYL